MKPLISIIAAISRNRVLGRKNQLLWHLPEDLKRFKKLTLGHPLIMGRKTHQSIGRRLPNRTNIIVTRDQHFSAPGCLIAHSIKEAITIARKKDENEFFVIGGASLYRQFLPLADRIYLTKIRQVFQGDVFFPKINSSDWQLISRQSYPGDNKNPYPYDFCLFKRKKK